MATGENEQGLRKIIDFTRMLSFAILTIHIYLSCYSFFRDQGLVSTITDRILMTLEKMKVFESNLFAKCSSLLLLIISLVGAKGRKDENVAIKPILMYFILGLVLYFSSSFLLYADAITQLIASSYIGLTSIGYILILTSGTRLSRILHLNLIRDVFNKDNETFPQEERVLKNEFSINLPALYSLKGDIRQSHINIINPFRGTLILGTPGSGKSYFVIRHIITQHIKKGFGMFIYDFKYDDLTKIAYNTLLANNKVYKASPSFYVINFEDLSRTHRCNPLDPVSMTDITDATEASRTIMLGLNREWIKKQGDFFVESPINFVTAIIWYLRKYKDGEFCTLPHVIELMQVDYKELFALLTLEPEIEVLINPFISAWRNEAFDQLEGQVASAKISMARLSSPSLYYILSGNDFTLDINNPEEPKVVCMGNNPQKQQVYGAVLSLYVSRMIKQVNQKDKSKCSLIFDEFPTIYVNNMDSLIATARSNKVATTLAVQDFSQLKKDYGKEQADVILNIIGNIISGQVTGDTAKHLSERFGKILQQRQSVSVNSNDTSVSRSTQLDHAIPASKISALSSGEFVGMVADDPFTKIDLKVFHNEIVNDHEGIKNEEEAFIQIPKIRDIDSESVQANYFQIRQDIQELIASELGAEKIQDDKVLKPNISSPQKMRPMSL
jgi:hypothetical protein